MVPPPDPNLIDLSRGWPHPSLLPTHLIKSAAQRALSDPAISVPALCYGPDPGYEPVRESIARWMTDFYHPNAKGQGDAVTADRIAISGGASQNLGNVLNVYTDPGYTRCVWVVAPAYFLAFRIFQDAGLQMRAVPEDDEGLDIAYLEQEIKKVDAGPEPKHRFKNPAERTWAKTYKHVIYCVPTHANPSSKTMSLPRRRDLVRLARAHDALIITDDVYDFLSWPSTPSEPVSTTAPLPRLTDVDRALPGGCDPFGNTCSNGSLSKLAGPGIRVGWCEGTPAFAFGISQAGTTKSGGAPSQLTSTYVNIMLEDGSLQAHIRETLIPAYRRRWTELMTAVEKELVPLGFGMPPLRGKGREVAGGYFTWLTLPEVLCAGGQASAAEALTSRCLKDAGVVIAPGDGFEVPGDHDEKITSFGGCVRLCWSWEDEGRLSEGVERIAGVAGEMIREAEADAMTKGEGEGIRKGYVMVEKKKSSGAEREADGAAS